jgi:hypothetical protein
VRAQEARIPYQGEDAPALRLRLRARRLFAAILQALGISLPSYYAVQSRALGGLLKACGKRKRAGPERDVSKLKREVERLRQECARCEALLRSAQRGRQAELSQLPSRP